MTDIVELIDNAIWDCSTPPGSRPMPFDVYAGSDAVQRELDEAIRFAMAHGWPR